MKNTELHQIQFSIIVCVYNCSITDLLNTLNSIIYQEDIVFQVVIADDFSHSNFLNKVDIYMRKNKFTNYLYIRNDTNLGTVNNILNAMQYCDGEYIKVIGSGDLLHDSHTLKQVYLYMINNKYEICFGNGYSYKEENKNVYISKYYSPLVLKPYVNNQENSIKKNLIIYGDQISGALTFYSKKCLLKYLKIISNKIIYVEDYIPRLAALDNIKIGYINRIVIFYQYGTGISTNINKKYNDRLKKDEESFTELIAKYGLENSYVKEYLKFWALRNELCILRIIKKIILQPSYLLYYFNSYLNLKRNFTNWKIFK